MTSDNITVIMKPTNQCNLRCKYCYHADNGYDKEKMTDQVLEKAIAVTAPFFKRVEYNWHGGEPLIMGLDFYERVLYYQKKYRQGPGYLLLLIIFTIPKINSRITPTATIQIPTIATANLFGCFTRFMMFLLLSTTFLSCVVL